MYPRLITRPGKHSFFLFGARGTGKSTWLEKEGLVDQKTFWVDLLDFKTEDRLARNPASLDEELENLSPEIQWVVIDEVQKIPRLLDSVHRWIEKKRFHFALTGSSARKLRRGSANLLAGRAFVLNLFPLTHRELGKSFRLSDALRFGGLPEVFQQESEQEKKQFLEAYAQTYLKEEIIAEQLVRKVTPFRRFLEVAALNNGEILNFSNMAQEVGVDRISIQTYYEILEETLVGKLLEPFHRSIRKRQRHNPKFYFFDTGVRNALAGDLDNPLNPKTFEFGRAFEHFVLNEIFRLANYSGKSHRFSYLRTKNDVEIDLIIERSGKPICLVEIKSATELRERDISSLKLLSADIKNSKAYCLSLDPRAKKIGRVVCLPWQEGLIELGL